ncbi:hypothetical protein [Gordonia sp. ABSL49_1]|uniref:hypothetical protein n=1 Tax=Gordonia sp. ABSL49_1 TaxID=2920941 RepID=UPI001F0ED4ED|nr:hypothetical protein [Gordonia sp. ABSL49_1]MCH5644371.1 hypothetical protein [Gordonia sp. ABSL49_1]
MSGGDRTFWCERAADALDRIESESMSTEQIRVLALVLETLTGESAPRRPVLTLV